MDAAGQPERFGYNADFIAFMSLPRRSENSDNGLLCGNNEYDMPDDDDDDDEGDKRMTAAQVALCNMAIGHLIVEVKREVGVWAMVQDSPMKQRITLDTPMAISGPVAGHA